MTVYEAAGDFDALLRLAHAWHTRVLEDEVVRHAFSNGYHPSAPSASLRTGRRHLVEPQRTPSVMVTRRPSCAFTAQRPHEEMDKRAIACFDQALQDAGLDSDERLRRVLHDTC